MAKEELVAFSRADANRIMNAVERVESGAREKIVRRKSVSVGGSGVKQLKIKSIEGDYLVCRTWDGTTEGPTDVKVAKPYLLRKTPFDGETIGDFSYEYTSDVERTITDTTDDSTEDQVIIPEYAVDDIIYAVRGVSGGTDVKDDSGEDVRLLDLNVDGRAWAKDA